MGNLKSTFFFDEIKTSWALAFKDGLRELPFSAKAAQCSYSVSCKPRVRSNEDI